MATSSSAISVLIGGVVGASFGKSVSSASKSIGDFRQKTESEMTRLGSVMALRNLDLSKYRKIRTESMSLGKAVSESRDRTTELGKRLASTQAAAKHFPSLAGDVKSITKEFEQSKKATAALEQKWQSAAGKTNALSASLRKSRDEHRAVQGTIARHRTELERLSAVEEGRARISAGKTQISDGVGMVKTGLGVGAGVVAASIVPTMAAANYQSLIRRTAITGGFANTQQERDMSENIIAASQRTGYGKNDLAQAVGGLVSGGMDSREAISYSELIGKFAVGQDASGEETAAMLNALSANANIKSQEGMEQALNTIAYLGKEGNFEAKDMAKHFPALLSQMKGIGITGQDSVTQLGSMLQVARLSAGSADQAANNMQNWIASINKETTKKAYADAGFNYDRDMKINLNKGYSTLESSLGMAAMYIEGTDPKQAKRIQEFADEAGKETDAGKKAKMISAFEEAMKTGDLFRDQQVKMALLAYMQNKDLYQRLKRESAQAKGIIDDDLAAAREASEQKWSEVGQSFDLAMTRIGQAIRPITDTAADALKVTGEAVASVSQKFPQLAQGTLLLGGAVASTLAVLGTAKAVSGAFGVAKGVLMTRGASTLLSTTAMGGKGILGRAAGALGIAGGAQPVFVTNWPGGGLGMPVVDGGLGKPAVGKKPGIGYRLGRATGGVVNAGRAALAAPTLGAIATGGAGTMAAAGGAVVAAGAVGYGIGTIINKGIDKAVQAATGNKNQTLGGLIYDKLHPEETKAAAPQTATSPPIEAADLAKVAALPATEKPAAASAVPQQTIAFAPKLDIKVEGDVKDPRRLAEELMPHMKRLLDQFAEKAARGDLFDPAHV